jgi:hypothetical protein
MAVPSIPAVSKEYVHVAITSDVTLDTQAVEFAYLAGSATPDDATTWLAAAWAGDPSPVRTAQSLIGPGSAAGELAVGLWNVYVRVTDTAEIPVRFAGQIKIV